MILRVRIYLECRFPGTTPRRTSHRLGDILLSYGYRPAGGILHDPGADEIPQGIPPTNEGCRNGPGCSDGGWHGSGRSLCCCRGPNRVDALENGQFRFLIVYVVIGCSSKRLGETLVCRCIFLCTEHPDSKSGLHDAENYFFERRTRTACDVLLLLRGVPRRQTRREMQDSRIRPSCNNTHRLAAWKLRSIEGTAVHLQ